jgi:hypothetical protein
VTHPFIVIDYRHGVARNKLSHRSTWMTNSLSALMQINRRLRAGGDLWARQHRPQFGDDFPSPLVLFDRVGYRLV